MFKDLQTRKARLSRPSKFRRYASDLAGFAVQLAAFVTLAAVFVAICYASAYFARFN
jgi:ABC-type multidrug transport system permease subunit